MATLNVRIPRELLVALTGSEKQIAWANDIRERLIRRKEEEYEETVKKADAIGRPMPTQEQVDAALKQVAAQYNAHTDARWWIDHHSMTA